MTGLVCNGVQFNVGDSVRVVRSEVDHAVGGMGADREWYNAWTEDMDEYIGKDYTIAVIDPSLGVQFVEDGGYYYFPLTSLELS